MRDGGTSPDRTEVGVSPVPRPRAAAAEWYTRIGRWYGAFAGPFEREYREAGRELLAPEPGERVLEIGSGTGEDLVALAEAVGPDGCVVGVDIADGMCRLAQRRVRESGVADRASVVRGDAVSLPIATASVDAAFASFTLELFDAGDVSAVLSEVRRVLEPGGRLCIISLSSHERTILSRIYERFHRRYPVMLDCRPIPVARLLRDADLHIETLKYDSMWGMPVVTALAKNEESVNGRVLK